MKKKKMREERRRDRKDSFWTQPMVLQWLCSSGSVGSTAEEQRTCDVSHVRECLLARIQDYDVKKNASEPSSHTVSRWELSVVCQPPCAPAINNSWPDQSFPLSSKEEGLRLVYHRLYSLAKNKKGQSKTSKRGLCVNEEHKWWKNRPISPP